MTVSPSPESRSPNPGTLNPMNVGCANRCPNTWIWQGLRVCYEAAGDRGPAIVLVHGFGASWRHWQKNIPFLGRYCRTYALDAIGFGGSDKPPPGDPIDYTFETWGQQIVDFCREVVGEPAYLVGNSIGCVIAMQAAVVAPDWARGVALLNCSLRLLHDRRRAELSWFQRSGAPLLQRLLGMQWFGRWFFRQVATPKNVRRALLQAYHHPEAVTDELVNLLMEPAGDPGAADVFLSFVRYSQGPLPEDLLAVLPCPALVIWGTDDPWEPVDRGRAFEQFKAVERFITLEGAGHCPQDEAPVRVNYILRNWILHQAGIQLPQIPLEPGTWVEICVERPDGDKLWNGLCGRVQQVGARAVTVRLQDDLGKRHFYREDLHPIPEDDPETTDRPDETDRSTLPNEATE